MKQQFICYLGEDGASGRITWLRLALRVVAKATLSSLVLAIISQNMKQQFICYLGEDGASGRITWLRLALRVVAKATLSSLVLAIISQNMKQQSGCYLGEYGASGRIRTSDRSVRSRVLYPAELRMHRDLLLYY